MKKLNLTNIQRAYLLGRESEFELGGCSTHVYYEFTNQLEPERFEKALNQIIQMQPVMRSVIEKDGTQTILEQVETYHVKCMHWENMCQREIEDALKEKREQLSHEVILCGQWPMFSFEFAYMPDGTKRLFVSYDLIVSDAFSFVVLAHEIQKAYEGHEVEPLTADYETYLNHLEEVKNSRRYLRDKEYWTKRLSTVLQEPKLPYEYNEARGKEFGRHHWYVEADVWGKVKEKLEQLHITPTVGVLAAYAATISFWCNQDSFTINLPMTSVMRKKKGMERVVGDFTESMLLTLPKYGDSMESYMNTVSQKFFEAFKHNNYDGIQIMGDIRKEYGETIMLPVVFTGMISDEIPFDYLDFLGEMVYGISQTPQVKLDCQVFETHGMLKVVWDYKKCYFRQEEIDILFEQFIQLLYKLAETEASPDVPQQQKHKLEQYNATSFPQEAMTLNQLMESAAPVLPERIILQDVNETYTEAEVQALSEGLAVKLQKQGIKKGERVGVLGERCAKTVIAILAVIKAGAAYVPINPQYPVERRSYILEKSKCRILLTPNDVVTTECGETKPACGAEPNDDAYVIYTSGSTGTPKGVVISQDAVCNTLVDMNDRFQVTAEDVFLNVASFGFDLSVYDVFGSMAAKAKLVVAEDARDISAIIRTIKDAQVTIWNSVPAEMGLVVDLMEENERIDSLRLVLLSGDWIPVDLPKKIKVHFPNAQIVSLGGATEASIWSILYSIEEDMSDRNSIPYGYPMRNQQMYILDEYGRQLPLEVEGEIFIGGRGVAVCYDADEEKTAAAFMEHPQLGRLYRTGDYGIMKRAGYMEFRGRKDSQIKIHGYRVELGEIESVMLKIDGVKKALVQKIENDILGDELIGYIVTEHIPEASQNDKDMKENIMKAVEHRKAFWEETTDFSSMAEYMEQLEAMATISMGRLFADTPRITDLKQWMQQRGMTEKYERLLKSWLNELVAVGYMEYINDIWSWKKELPKESVEERLLQLHKLPGVEQVKEIEEYFLKCCQQHEGLLQEKVNPLELFYGEAKSDVAENIYGSNQMSQIANELMGVVIKEFVGERKVRILELGAGIGSIATEVFKEICDKDIEYVYSDISDFFLNKAKDNFKYDFMEYQVLDINENLQSQGCGYGEFDMVLISNTLHDAEDVYRTLEYIREVLKKDGWLFILETTKNTRTQMTSFGFMEGLANCCDFRKDSRGPMLEDEEWIQVLDKSGYCNVMKLITETDFDGKGWQNIFVAQNALGMEDIPETDVLEFCSLAMPGYMLPAKIYRMQNFPLSINGKVDKKQLPRPKRKSSRKTYVAPETEMEKRLVKIWEEHMNLEQVSVTDSFFELGGDSLKAIKLVTMAEKEGIHLELADLYQYNTIRKLAKNADFTEKDIKFIQEKEEEEMCIQEDELDLILEALG